MEASSHLQTLLLLKTAAVQALKTVVVDLGRDRDEDTDLGREAVEKETVLEVDRDPDLATDVVIEGRVHRLEDGAATDDAHHRIAHRTSNTTRTT